MNKRMEDVLFEHTGDRSPKAKDARKAAAEIRGRADRFGAAAVSDELREDADRLDAYADGLGELDAVAKDIGADKAPRKAPRPGSAKPKAGAPKTSKRSSGSTARPGKRSTGKVGRAARRAAIDTPQDIVAGKVASAGSIFWTFALGTVALILVYNLVSHAPRAARLLDSLGQGAARIAYPRTVFPERYGAPAAATQRQSVTSSGPRLVPITTRTTRS